MRIMLKRLLQSLAAATVVVSLLPLAARYSWALDLFANFRLQYIVVQLGLIVALGFARSPGWLAAVVGAAAITAVPLFPYLPLHAAAASKVSGTPVSVLSVNVQQRNRDYARTIELIRNANADLVLILELTPGLAAALDGLDALYPQRLLRPSDGPFGIGLLSRRQPAMAVKNEPGAAHPSTAYLSATELGATPAAEAKLDVGGTAVDFIGVHLMPPTNRDWAAERRRQLDLLAARVRTRQRPTIVCGDFNLTPYSPFFGDLLEQSGLRDGRGGRGLQTSWPTFMPLLGIPIDHCLVSPEIGVAASRRLDAFGSDHYPVLFDLLLEGQP
jgi:endonuclease/exonuclease/phosphatase (EEP) superfamily protein YafD